MTLSNPFTKLVIVFILFIGVLQPVKGQDTLRFKTVNGGQQLRILPLKENPSVQEKTLTPAVILLSGGGWKDFSWSQLKDLGKDFAKQGAQVFVVEYRASKYYPEATPFDALDDVQDAIFYLRENAKTLRIDPKSIVAVGASAGAHLAFASRLANPRKLAPISQYQPNYIVGYSPVIRNDEAGYAFDRIGGENAPWFSPWNVYMESDAKLPPSIIFSGDKDPLIKIKDLETFAEKAAEKGDKIALHTISDVGHSMRNTVPDIYEQTSPKIMAFLTENGLSFEPKDNKLLYLGAGIVVGVLLFIFMVIRRNRIAKRAIE